MRAGILFTYLLTVAIAVCEPAIRPSASLLASEVRQPAVAGKFYPADEQQLTRAIAAFLAKAHPPCGERPVVMIVPHAGYIYSGQIAADGYRQASDYPYELVVIIGTNHTQPPFEGVSVYAGTGYRTPLGIAEIDQKTAAALRDFDSSFSFRSAVHAREHSVEVQVPFVQAVFPEVKIVVAVAGSSSPALAAKLGKALATVLAGRRALVVASSDLSHYPQAADARAADTELLRAIVGGDPRAVLAEVDRQMNLGRPGLSTCACGLGPILTAMHAADHLGARGAHVISYAHSGDAAVGQPDRVVGYGAVVFTGGPPRQDAAALQPPPVAAADAALNAADRQALLTLARETIDQYLTTQTTPLARGYGANLNRQQGAFVTLKRDGELRGCIGHLAADRPLCQVVGAMALQAAFNDRRFSPLQWAEWSDIDIEISVLTPFQKVSGPADIVLGRDGVVMEKAGRSAVFLPQVATENDWNREQMLAQLSRKAGLPADAWQEGATLYTFQAEVFHEETHP
jgi:AmmeMemoRadiSam system protein B/AmmeMemoRadiSam system protein A